MSFDDDNRKRYNDYSSYQGGRNSGTNRSSPSGDRKTSVTNNLMTMSSNITALQKLTNQLGTTRDSSQIREQLASLVAETRELASQTANILKRWEDTDKDSRIHKTKLMKEYQMLLQQFGDIAKYSAEKERNQPLQKKREAQYPDVSMGGVYQDPHLPSFANSDTRNNVDRDADFFQRQQQVDFQNLQIDDRNDSIKDLEKSVIEINELFIDVAKLVKDSQPMIDSIESNVESSVVQTDRGVIELRKASDYQKSSRTKLCCLLLILIIIAAVVGIIIWATLKR